MNADILPGPNATNTPVDAKQFFDAAKQLKDSTLSIGWTTNSNAIVKDSNANYTNSHVDEMIKAIKENKIEETSHPITFPIRAALAVLSKDTLTNLHHHVSEFHKQSITYTIWSADKDEVDPKELQSLIQSFGIDKTYLDIPKNLRDQMDLSQSSGASSFIKFGFLNLAAFTFTLLFRNGLVH